MNEQLIDSYLDEREKLKQEQDEWEAHLEKEGRLEAYLNWLEKENEKLEKAFDS